MDFDKTTRSFARLAATIVFATIPKAPVYCQTRQSTGGFRTTTHLSSSSADVDGKRNTTASRYTRRNFESLLPAINDARFRGNRSDANRTNGSTFRSAYWTFRHGERKNGRGRRPVRISDDCARPNRLKRSWPDVMRDGFRFIIAFPIPARCGKSMINN